MDPHWFQCGSGSRDLMTKNLKKGYRLKTLLIYFESMLEPREPKVKCRYLKNLPVNGLCGRCLSGFIDW